MCQQIYTIINSCIHEHNSGGEGSGDRNGVDPPLNHHYLFKGQEAHTIINGCVFVNTIQEEVDMEIDIAKPIWTITTPLSVNKSIPS